MDRDMRSGRKLGPLSAFMSWLLAVAVFAISLVGVWIIALSNTGKVGADPQMMDTVTTAFICVSGSIGLVGATLSWLSRAKARSIAHGVLGLVALASFASLSGMWIATGGLSR